jgi:putative transposase
VIALRSNIRWCSDYFELACRGGETVGVLFAIDACDREVMARLATFAGISGRMVRESSVDSELARRPFRRKVVPTTAQADEL